MTTTLQTPDLAPGFWDVGLRQYHSDRTCESHTTLDDFRDSSSAFNMRWNLGTLPRPEPSDAFRLGIGLHAWTLEPGRFAELVAVGPPEASSRTKKFAEFEAVVATRGMTAISDDQFQLAKAMGQALRDNPVAGPLVFDAKGRNEQAIRWQDPETGIWLKCCFDRLLECGIELNLKTSRDPNPKSWVKDAANFGYHRQSALYRDGREIALGFEARDFEQLHVIVGSEPPHLVAVYEMQPESINQGRHENRVILNRLDLCRRTGNWQDEWEVSVTPVQLPKWAFY